MKLKFIYTSLSLLFLASLFISSSGGRNDAKADAPGDGGYCINCHGATPPNGGISLTGAPVTYQVGTTYPLTITVTNTTALVGGFQIVATDGSTNTQIGTFIASAGTRINPLNRLVQDAPQAFSGGSTSWTFNWTAPASGAPANVEFYFAGIAANNNGNTGGDYAFAGNSAIVPLPVELSQFDVQSIGGTEVKVTWQTQSEQNSRHFEIQRSIPTSDNTFETIGQIDAAENSEWINDYEYMDRFPILNKYAYYRLKQVDTDGQFTFSAIQSLKIDRSQQFSIYPNPLRRGENLNVQLENDQSQNENIRIYNMNGQVFYDNQNELSNGDLSLDVSNLPVGVYFVSIYNQNEIVETKKLVVRD